MDNKDYTPADIEKKWQDIWDKENIYLTQDKPNKENKYVLDMFPYPSGAGLHVGHPEGYTATDIYTRYLRLKGYNVLHPMGWDAFGLPAENYAIKTGVHPEDSTNENIKNFKRQIKSIGLSYDWSREINTSSPDYYKWTQWLFLQLFKNGLAYQKKSLVNWCPKDQTVLANEQVVNGHCERCGSLVEQKNLKQWFFKITDYADELLAGINELDWPEPIKTMQLNWIGKSTGAEVDFRVKNCDHKIRVYTTRPDTLFGATYLVLAPDYYLVDELKKLATNQSQIDQYIEETRLKSELDRLSQVKDKTGVKLEGLVAINPVNNEEITIWLADYVLSSYGTGAIMAVPAHDERDFEFAKKFDLPIRQVIAGQQELPFADQGELINSGEFTGINSVDTTKLIEKYGTKKTQYKLRDWLVSRQRYWGTPIPIIYCDSCGVVPVPEADLPVILPRDIDFKPTGHSPLVDSKEFNHVKCPKCGQDAKRESDTLDTFIDSSWYFLRYTDPKNTDQLAASENIKKWCPVDMYVGGAEHAVLHLLYSRFITKVLADQNLINFREPFTKLMNQGLIMAQDGRKMSKSLGNVVNPDDVIEQYGADTLRIYEMFMGPLADAKPWSTTGIIGSFRFLQKVYKISQTINFSQTVDDLTSRNLEKVKDKVTRDIEGFNFNTAISALMEFIKYLEPNKLTQLQWEDFLIILSPFAPHLAQELWSVIHPNDLIDNVAWVKINSDLLNEDNINLPIQVNGKLKCVISLSKSLSREEIEAAVLTNDLIKNIVQDKPIKKIIVVPLKIVNIIC